MAAGILALLAGCSTPARFPAPTVERADPDELVREFDTNADGRVDYWQYRPAGRRTAAIALAQGVNGTRGPRIALDDVAAGECPHVVIVLDGVPFEVIDELYRWGHLRLFHPPAAVVCAYPAMTDLALTDLFHAGQCSGYQALYFDRAANKVAGGSADYLKGLNAPWMAQVDYRCSLWLDTLVYVDPRFVFERELAGIWRVVREPRAGTSYVYSVGSAGLGTREGRAGMEAYLLEVERLCERLVHERRGRVKITLTADHGHNLVPNRRVTFDAALRAGGWRPARTLRDPRDVVSIEYGLVTYAEFHTRNPAGVAECLLGHPDVALAYYRAGDEIVVRDARGTARIRQVGSGLAYERIAGDPLRLGPVLAQLGQAGRIAADGGIDAQALFAATLEHDYPDPLARLWRAFHDLVRNAPDLLVDLRPGACHGSAFFHSAIGGDVASTHGALDRRNSVTFAMTMLGELPRGLRGTELLPMLEALRNDPDRAQVETARR